jgi:uncharacterized protein (DUF885 family)
MSMPDALEVFAEAFLNAYYERHPTYAGFLGFHEYDGRVPDFSQAAIKDRVKYLQAARSEIMRIDAGQLEKAAWLDFQLLRDAIQFELFDLSEWRRWQRDPQTYLWPMSVDQYIKRDYAPLAHRVQALIRHLRAFPAVVQQARANLVDVAAPVLETAVKMLEGNISFVEEDLALALSELRDSSPTLYTDFEDAQSVALSAGRELLAHFHQVLEPQASAEFAIGAEAFGKMLQFGEAVDVALDRLLEIGQADLARNKEAFVETAARIKPGISPLEVVKQVTQEHPTVERLVPETRAMLEELRQWIIDHDIVSVPSEDRCRVEETPKFMRWAFAMMDSAGPFESVAREAYYYVTPPEPDWSAEKQEEWLSQFDYYGLRDTSIHEAWPGHFLNDLHFRNAPSKVAKIFSAYSFWEAWAHYCEQMMLEQGYRAGDDKLQLAQLSGALVRNVRYVCAIQMHTRGMSVDEATTRFMHDAFMEETPARAEAVRGTFDPQYLNYTLGKLMLLKLRKDYKAELGDAFDLKTFHDAFLAWGGPPVPYLRHLILRHDDGEIL